MTDPALPGFGDRWTMEPWEPLIPTGQSLQDKINELTRGGKPKEETEEEPAPGLLLGSDQMDIVVLSGVFLALLVVALGVVLSYERDRRDRIPDDAEVLKRKSPEEAKAELAEMPKPWREEG